jgi:DNA-binding ferritin-like protein
MIEQLISRVFYARNLAHFAHWRAQGEGSFAKHDALGDFYPAVIDAIDPIVESLQALHKLIGAIPLPNNPPSDILKCLQDDVAWIEEHHEEICQGSRAVANLIDTLTETYLSAIYKLRYLK